MSSQIELRAGSSRAVVSPDNGATVTEFSVDGEDILFPDQLVQTSKGLKRRGGIPVLFPNAGPDETLPQHGFARNIPWELRDISDSYVRMLLRYDDETLKVYPYHFLAELSVQLREGSLEETLMINASRLNQRDMPIAPGFHPFFKIEDTDKPKLSSDLPFDGAETDWQKLQDEARVIDTHDRTVRIDHPTVGAISLETFALPTQVVWSEVGQPYVCFEPWRGPVNHIHDSHTGGTRVRHSPRAFSFKISLVAGVGIEPTTAAL
jgi:galactose mutarotase-like enzyme